MSLKKQNFRQKVSFILDNCFEHLDEEDLKSEGGKIFPICLQPNETLLLERLYPKRYL